MDAGPKHGGGLAGYMRGTQSLANAFWLAGFFPVFIAASLLLFYKTYYEPDTATYLLVMLCSIVPIRLFAWTSIIRCAHNVVKDYWGIIAGIIVALDILLFASFWLGALNSLYVEHRVKGNVQRYLDPINISRCQKELSRVSGREQAEIGIDSFEAAGAGETQTYELYVQGDPPVFYKCYINAFGKASVEKD